MSVTDQTARGAIGILAVELFKALALQTNLIEWQVEVAQERDGIFLDVTGKLNIGLGDRRDVVYNRERVAVGAVLAAGLPATARQQVYLLAGVLTDRVWPHQT